MTEVLFWADAPVTSTGFATVSKNILKVLEATGKYRFTVLGVAYLGIPFDVKEYPYLEYPKHGGIYAASEGGDPYGSGKCLQMLATGEFDILFILNDISVMMPIIPEILKLRKKMERHFKIIFYFPNDGPPKKEWAQMVEKVDFPVAYTNYGYTGMVKQCPELEGKLPVIYHGTDKQVFHPFPEEKRLELKKLIFGPHAEKFLIMNINRNNPRKDMNSTFEVFAKLKAKRPNVYLYILGAMNDFGGNLEDIARQHGLVWQQDWCCPNVQLYNPNQGMPIQQVVELYNCADLIMTTTLGEGWGLSLTEAMACKRPLVAPRHSSITEIIGDNEERGWLIASGGFGHTVCQGSRDNNNVRPVVHHEDMVDRIKKIMDYPGQSAKKIEAAFEWVPTWEKVCQKWLEVFEKASPSLKPATLTDVESLLNKVPGHKSQAETTDTDSA